MKIIIVILIAVLTAAGLYLYKERDVYMKKLESLEKQLPDKCSVYVAVTDIPAGSIIEPESVVLREISLQIKEELCIVGNITGAKALTDICSGTPLIKGMISTELVSSDLKEYEISTVKLMADQKENDCIDIRIMFADGSDFLVLSKKTINGLDSDTSTFHTECTAAEIHVMSSALTDAEEYEGTRLYAVRYVDGGVQDAAVQTYPVREEVAGVMEADLNITDKTESDRSLRRTLEDRLKLQAEKGQGYN